MWSMFERTEDDLLPSPQIILGTYIAMINFIFELQELELYIETKIENDFNTFGKKNIVADFNGLTFNGNNLGERLWMLTNDRMNHDEVWNFMYACVGRYVPIALSLFNRRFPKN